MLKTCQALEGAGLNWKSMPINNCRANYLSNHRLSGSKIINSMNKSYKLSAQGNRVKCNRAPFSLRKIKKNKRKTYPADRAPYHQRINSLTLANTNLWICKARWDVTNCKNERSFPREKRGSVVTASRTDPGEGTRYRKPRRVCGVYLCKYAPLSRFDKYLHNRSMSQTQFKTAL